MSKEMSEQEIAIISALAASVTETIGESIEDAVCTIEEKVQFLVDAELIEEGVDNAIIRMALHLAVDSLCDEIEDEEDSDKQSDDDEVNERCY
jgi:hypothetical protein